MRIEQLRYFVIAAETLSFTETSRLCQVAQPAVSQQIKKMETELGFSLFVRTSHGLVLTEAGSLYYSEVAKALGALETARLRAKCVAEGSAGLLTIGACGSTQGSDLATIKDFRYRFPNVELAFRGVSTRRQAEQLLENEFDICYTDVRQLDNIPTVRFMRPETRSLCVMAHRDNPFAHRAPVTFEDAMAQTVIFAESSHGSREGKNVSLDLPACVTGRVVYADTQENVQLMLRLDMGIAIAPDSVATSVSDDIAIVPTAGPWPTITLAWAYVESNANPALELFKKFLS